MTQTQKYARPHRKFRHPFRWAVLLLLLLLAAVGIKTAATPALRNRVVGSAQRLLFPAAAWDGQVDTEAEEAVAAYGEAHGIPADAWPEEVVELLERNPETRDFVLHYPEKYGNETETDLAEVDCTNGVPLLMQWDERWGYLDYGSGVAGVTGCGPLCLAMVGYFLTGSEAFYPDRVISFAVREGYCVPGNGTSWTLFSKGAEKLGLQAEELPLDEGILRDRLAAGEPVVCVVGPGDFTAEGHYLVIAGAEEGGFRVNDPNSRANSAQIWSYDRLAPQIQNLWAFRAAG